MWVAEKLDWKGLSDTNLSTWQHVLKYDNSEIVYIFRIILARMMGNVLENVKLYC
jgi:hypothetical protein